MLIDCSSIHTNADSFDSNPFSNWKQKHQHSREAILELLQEDEGLVAGKIEEILTSSLNDTDEKKQYHVQLQQTLQELVKEGKIEKEGRQYFLKVVHMKEEVESVRPTYMIPEP